eukprot:TRINITY_DN32143_c0_g1_i1.p1 TRINITY_DN32143_c0_g1~~TRINITY_DN32143_c0_g1_i1.p1  ORF type:complete len:255 (+),score=45.77 TRINITY_DN32143_c0_g1_i1:241-1005(+)
MYSRRRDATLVDPHLTEVGVAQARTAAARLVEQLLECQDGQPEVIVTSTLRRALHTAELAALPVAAPAPILLALDIACEIQFGDIWNEPRDRCSVNAEWPRWMIEPANPWSDCGTPPLETADKMVARVEKVWQRLHELETPVVVFVAHGCLLGFLVRRASLATDGKLDGSFFRNGEVRRIYLPPPDGRQLCWTELVDELALARKALPEGQVSFWNRFSRRAAAITKAGKDAAPEWAEREWRYAQHDEDFDAKLM